MEGRRSCRVSGVFSRVFSYVFAAVFAVTLALTAPLATAADTSAQTKYPVVLVHGLMGYSKMLGKDYFYGIPSVLQNSGAKVYVAQVSALNSNEARGEQLLQQVQAILAITGAQKVNLIGHSQGGPTARYVAGVAPQLVASVTTVGGVNHGSKVADLVRGLLPPGSVLESIAAGIFKVVGTIISWLSDAPAGTTQDPVAALDALTTVKTAAFNAKFPDGLPQGCTAGPGVGNNGVYYFSWTGKSIITNLLDTSDYTLALAAPIHGEANDGMVSVCSSKLGTDLGVYKQNHLDEVNQSTGLVDWFSVSPVTLYRNHAQRLKNQGL